MTKFCFHPSLVAVYGSEIRDLGWVKIRIRDLGFIPDPQHWEQGIRDKQRSQHPPGKLCHSTVLSFRWVGSLQ